MNRDVLCQTDMTKIQIVLCQTDETMNNDAVSRYGDQIRIL